MSTKHFVNNADELVVDALEALTLTNPDLVYYKTDKIITRASHDGSKTVSIVSGGGAGHEPAHAGYVGQGMLSGVASGWIFASPSVAQIVHAGQIVAGTKGVLLVIKNYTGDIFHFMLAAEKLKSQGIDVATVVVGDDVAVGRTKSGKVGRRGLAGTVLVHKAAGAMAAKQSSTLPDVLAVSQAVAENLVTIGVSLNHVHIPGRKIETENLISEQEVELGLGIHNEKGCLRLSPIPSLPEIVTQMLDQLLDPNDIDRGYVDFSSAGSVVLMVNNLGGLSPLELSAITTEVVSQAVNHRHLNLVRLFSGTYMTSLDGPGFSITFLRATSEIVALLDEPTEAVGFLKGSVVDVGSLRSRVIAALEADPQSTSVVKTKSVAKIFDPSAFIAAITAGCYRVIAAEPRITEYDTVVGDGDCGYTLKRAAEAVLGFTETSVAKSGTVETFTKLAETVENNMDGTSGAIYAIYLHALAVSASRLGPIMMDFSAWAQIAADALQALYGATPARPGDRTLVDALVPFVEALVAGQSVQDAALAASHGAEKTKGMTASLGRAVYVDATGYDRVPDPGAVGVAELVSGFAQVL
ncbi:Dak1 domain-containing protein [Lipomyces oligophaga]|uniref:Dak1 domain-containing protein n=1 Tax=Lipomyces oligophaga TaxID=45792 RepID=UPI0034CDC524